MISLCASAMDIREAQSTAPAPSLQASNRRGKRWLAWLVWALVFIMALSIGFVRMRYDLRGYSVLAHALYPQATGPLLRWETYAVTTQEQTIPTSNGSIPARLYLPAGVAHPPGIVVVHGIHHLGIEEPRLVSFSRAIAGGGFAVLTPQVSALADYHVDAESIATIGESPAWLEKRLGTGPVTLVGVSFSGGLSLLAACDPRYAPHIRTLLIMGGYDDLSRVARFLATNRAELPNGRLIPYIAHPYGALVFVYAHLEHFFPAADLPVAHEALRYWLWEQPEKARPLLGQMSPRARATMEMLLANQIEPLRPRILEVIRGEASQMAALSPQGHIGDLRVPAFVLHGATDGIIPSSESLWLEKEIPRRYLRDVLITPAFSHVDAKKRTLWYEQLRLVDFLGEVLRDAS